MRRTLRIRIITTLLIALFVIAFPVSQNVSLPSNSLSQTSEQVAAALETLENLETKGRAPKTGYERAQFGDGWRVQEGCDTRNIILARDLRDIRVGDDCKVLFGTLEDPYTGAEIRFSRGASSSADVQIDHVVALSNAWQTGAQQLSSSMRENLANDPLNLLAVDGKANQQKSDGDAATWLPSNKSFRCQYVSRQLEVKSKYSLWLTGAEKDAVQKVLNSCA